MKKISFLITTKGYKIVRLEGNIYDLFVGQIIKDWDFPGLQKDLEHDKVEITIHSI